MHFYKHILVATDLTQESERVISKALEVANTSKAAVSLANVVEFTPMMYGGGEYTIPIEADLEKTMLEQAKERIAEQGTKFGLEADRLHIVEGSTKNELVNLVESLSADLLIVGGHDKHGMQLLFGSTANALLHALPCDVLTVKLPT